MTDPDVRAVKQAQESIWNSAARGWEKNDDQIREATEPVTRRLFELAELEPGQRVLDIASGDYKPVAEIALPDLGYIDDVAALYGQGRYQEGMRVFLAADGPEAEVARKVVAGYIAYAFQRVGEVAESINDIDRIMAMGFNWAPPSVLVDAMGAPAAVEIIEKAGLAVPEALIAAAKTGEPRRFFVHPSINAGRFFVAG